mmetsp:Transcript_55754/g.134465  ORF Transcript_55754/g.134465 Transcript_55754/m.134465 type:complete len:417 (+) Transcript_55754:287-1537(+)
MGARRAAQQELVCALAALSAQHPQPRLLQALGVPLYSHVDLQWLCHGTCGAMLEVNLQATRKGRPEQVAGERPADCSSRQRYVRKQVLAARPGEEARHRVHAPKVHRQGVAACDLLHSSERECKRVRGAKLDTTQGPESGNTALRGSLGSPHADASQLDHGGRQGLDGKSPRPTACRSRAAVLEGCLQRWEEAQTNAGHRDCRRCRNLSRLTLQGKLHGDGSLAGAATPHHQWNGKRLLRRVPLQWQTHELLSLQHHCGSSRRPEPTAAAQLCHGLPARSVPGERKQGAVVAAVGAAGGAAEERHAQVLRPPGCSAGVVEVLRAPCRAGQRELRRCVRGRLRSGRRAEDHDVEDESLGNQRRGGANWREHLGTQLQPGVACGSGDALRRDDTAGWPRRCAHGRWMEGRQRRGWSAA